MSPACMAQFFGSAMFFSTSAFACASAGRTKRLAAMHCRQGTLSLGSIIIASFLGGKLTGCLERVGRGGLPRHDVGCARFAGHGPLDRLLGGAVVELLDLLVVLGLPVDEH